MAILNIPKDMPIGKSAPAPAQPASDRMNVEALPIPELLDLRARVDAALPARSLKDLNLANELVLQVLALQAAQQRALNAEDTPTNQLAQAMSALTGALTTLVKLQTETYTSERLKKIELTLINAINTLPAEGQEVFLAAYELALEELD